MIPTRNAQLPSSSGDGMLVDSTKAPDAARPGPSSTLRPGDALTVWRNQQCSRATFFASSPTHLDVIWSDGELDGERETLPSGIKWLPGWHASNSYDQASDAGAFTASIDGLMHNCSISTVR